MLEKTAFFRATAEAETLPKNIAEIIFCGRSNVGKSSTINALCSQKNLARTSKTPGRTRTVNVYSVAMGRWIIDLPGYGFARVSPKEKELWQKMIETCIVERKTKKTVYIIVDAFVGPTDLDSDMAYWLKENGVIFKIVANKCDKVPEVNMPEVENKIAEFFGVEKKDVYAISAKLKKRYGKIKSRYKKNFKMKTVEKRQHTLKVLSDAVAVFKI